MITSHRPDVCTTDKYSLKEAAKALGIHPNTLYNHTKRGAIRVEYFAANGRPRYTGAEIIRYWNESI